MRADTTAYDQIQPIPPASNRWLRALIPAILALAGLVLGAVWALSSPLASSPDDNYHQTSIWCPSPLSTSGCTYWSDGHGKDGVLVPKLLNDAACYAFKPNETAECASAISPEETKLVTHVDRGEYPGLYYKFMHLFSGDDIRQSVNWMRLINVMIAVALIGAIALVGGRETRRLLTYSCLALIPLGIFLLSSINPSAWTVLGLLAVWPALYGYFTAKSTKSIIIFGGLATVAGIIAAGSRTDAGPYLAVIMLAACLLFYRRILSKPLLAFVPVGLIICGAIGFLTSGQTDVVTSGFSSTGKATGLSLLMNNIFELPSLFGGMVGLKWGLGWIDTPMPAITGILMVMIVGGLLMVGLRHLKAEKIAGLSVIVGTIIVIPLYILQISGNEVGENVQARYLLPLLAPLIGAALILPRRTGDHGVLSLSRSQTSVVYVLAVAAHAAALHRSIRRYVSGIDVKSFNLNIQVEWWPTYLPSPMVTWVLGSLAAAILGLALFRTRSQQPEAGTSQVAAI